MPAGDYLKVSAGGAGWDAVSSLAVAGRRDDRLRPRAAPRLGGRARRRGRDRLQRPRVHAQRLRAVGRRGPVLGTAWSTQAGAGEKYLVVRLPETIDVTQFGLDPGEGCGDTAASRHRRLPGRDLAGRRPPGPPRVNGVFTSAARHQLNFVTPTAGATGVRFVRLTLLSSQGFGAPFRDISEFGVYGRVAGVDTVDPETTLAPGGPPFVFSSRGGGDVRVPGRRGRVRGLHVAVPGGVARRRAYVLGAGGGCRG